MLKASKFDVSEGIRQLGALTAGPRSIYKVTASQLREKLLDEFDILVRETPQWTGTTAASWEIDFDTNITGDVETQPERTRDQALSKGSEAACGIAMAKASTSLNGDFKLYAQRDIVVANAAPGYDRAEEGPVRPENTPPGALKRFEARIALMDFEVDFYK